MALTLCCSHEGLSTVQPRLVTGIPCTGTPPLRDSQEDKVPFFPLWAASSSGIYPTKARALSSKNQVLKLPHALSLAHWHKPRPMHLKAPPHARREPHGRSPKLYSIAG